MLNFFRQCLKLSGKSFFILTYSILIAFLTALTYIFATSLRCLSGNLTIHGQVDQGALQTNQTIPMTGKISADFGECAIPVIAANAILLPTACVVYLFSQCCLRRCKTTAKSSEVEEAEVNTYGIYDTDDLVIKTMPSKTSIWDRCFGKKKK